MLDFKLSLDINLVTFHELESFELKNMQTL
jgi:hypothetical protein